MKNLFIFVLIAILGVACTSSGKRNGDSNIILESHKSSTNLYNIVEYIEDGHVQSLEWDDTQNIPRNYYKTGDTVIIMNSHYSDGEVSLHEPKHIYGKNSNTYLPKDKNFYCHVDSNYIVEYRRAVITKKLVKKK